MKNVVASRYIEKNEIFNFEFMTFYVLLLNLFLTESKVQNTDKSRNAYAL